MSHGGPNTWQYHQSSIATNNNPTTSGSTINTPSNNNRHMNVTAAPFRPPPFSLNQDPLLAAGLASGAGGMGGLHGSPSGAVGRSNSMHGSPNGGMGAPMGTGHAMGGGGGSPYNNNNTPLLHGIGGVPQQQQQGGPGKYKTELCRNWETTGTCNYRGCTYAHGYEDLRGGGGGGMMGQGLPPPQSMGTPQQHTYSFNNNVVNAGAAMGTASGRSSAMGTPVAGTYRIGGGLVAGPLGGPSGAPMAAGMGPSGLGGGTSPIPAPAPINNNSPQPINTSQPTSVAEQLIELIILEMRAEKEKLMNHQSTNRQLEQQLKREQLLRQRNVNNITVVEGVIANVEEAIRKRHATLTDMMRAMGEDTMEAAVDAMLDGDGY